MAYTDGSGSEAGVRAFALTGLGTASERLRTWQTTLFTQPNYEAYA